MHQTAERYRRIGEFTGLPRQTVAADRRGAGGFVSLLVCSADRRGTGGLGTFPEIHGGFSRRRP